MTRDQKINSKSELSNDMALGIVKRAKECNGVLIFKEQVIVQYGEYVRVCKFMGVGVKDIANEIKLYGIEV